ncbi:MAG TPA: hypothetical protein DEP45_07225, partial [Armatimonadetes bacterium]|nr:hypothetical protein [Armatimonadota bacterium]
MSLRRGTGYTLTVVALPVLLGVAALAVDLGLMSVAAERVQHVADLAALAGATRGTDETGAVVLADETASSNNAVSNRQVDIVVTTYGPGQEVPGYRSLGLREHVTDVVATTRFDFAFARIFGLEAATITRHSAALCEVWRNRLADGFIFAGETDPAVTGVYVEGSRCSFNGSIHSNTCMSLNGSTMTVNGDIHYRNRFEQGGPSFAHTGSLIPTPISSYPIDVTWSDFDRGTWDYQVACINIRNAGVTLPSGRWHVLGDMIVNGTGFSCHDSLFVVEGRIY